MPALEGVGGLDLWVTLVQVSDWVCSAPTHGPRRPLWSPSRFPHVSPSLRSALTCQTEPWGACGVRSLLRGPGAVPGQMLSEWQWCAGWMAALSEGRCHPRATALFSALHPCPPRFVPDDINQLITESSSPRPAWSPRTPVWSPAPSWARSEFGYRFRPVCLFPSAGRRASSGNVSPVSDHLQSHKTLQ